MSTTPVEPAVEDRLAVWLQQPGTTITPAEREFLTDMRKASRAGVGYGWMQQIIEWEWRHYLYRMGCSPNGALGPMHTETLCRAGEAAGSSSAPRE